MAQSLSQPVSRPVSGRLKKETRLIDIQIEITLQGLFNNCLTQKQSHDVRGLELELEPELELKPRCATTIWGRSWRRNSAIVVGNAGRDARRTRQRIICSIVKESLAS